jgi:hypothetical protein
VVAGGVKEKTGAIGGIGQIRAEGVFHKILDAVTGDTAEPGTEDLLTWPILGACAERWGPWMNAIARKTATNRTNSATSLNPGDFIVVGIFVLFGGV